ncbi:hypothetical protein [Haloactinomyces albus]|uniref:Uncharacterized protein n=1 Tax=Haloactinomyces albus TaxID=1352928 RepID=A0AAE4CQJ8_9ACTN|nr:hypothetical protein [Haloactinomyces albus]MDR7302758.1 hypothetical protein [Haloactinomyces albus]
MGETVEAIPRVEPHQEDTQARVSLSFDQWQQVAKAIIREGLNPHGVSVPDEDFRAWVKALDESYEAESLQEESAMADMQEGLCHQHGDREAGQQRER